MSIIGVVVISALTTLVIIGILLMLAHRFYTHRRGFFRHRAMHRFSTKNHEDSTSLDGTLDFVESALKLDAAQMQLWDEIKTALAQSRSEFYIYREVLATAANFEQRINRLEDFVNDSLIILQRLKPQLMSFYHSLNHQQQAVLERLISKKHFAH